MRARSQLKISSYIVLAPLILVVLVPLALLVISIYNYFSGIFSHLYSRYITNQSIAYPYQLDETVSGIAQTAADGFDVGKTLEVALGEQPRSWFAACLDHMNVSPLGFSFRSTLVLLAVVIMLFLSLRWLHLKQKSPRFLLESLIERFTELRLTGPMFLFNTKRFPDLFRFTSDNSTSLSTANGKQRRISSDLFASSTSAISHSPIQSNNIRVHKKLSNSRLKAEHRGPQTRPRSRSHNNMQTPKLDHSVAVTLIHNNSNMACITLEHALPMRDLNGTKNLMAINSGQGIEVYNEPHHIQLESDTDDFRSRPGSTASHNPEEESNDDGKFVNAGERRRRRRTKGVAKARASQRATDFSGEDTNIPTPRFQLNTSSAHYTTNHDHLTPGQSPQLSNYRNLPLVHNNDSHHHQLRFKTLTDDCPNNEEFVLTNSTASFNTRTTLPQYISKIASPFISYANVTAHQPFTTSPRDSRTDGGEWNNGYESDSQQPSLTSHVAALDFNSSSPSAPATLGPFSTPHAFPKRWYSPFVSGLNIDIIASQSSSLSSNPLVVSPIDCKSPHLIPIESENSGNPFISYSQFFNPKSAPEDEELGRVVLGAEEDEFIFTAQQYRTPGPLSTSAVGAERNSLLKREKVGNHIKSSGCRNENEYSLMEHRKWTGAYVNRGNRSSWTEFPSMQHYDVNTDEEKGDGEGHRVFSFFDRTLSFGHDVRNN